MPRLLPEWGLPCAPAEEVTRSLGTPPLHLGAGSAVRTRVTAAGDGRTAHGAGTTADSRGGARTQCNRAPGSRKRTSRRHASVHASARGTGPVGRLHRSGLSSACSRLSAPEESLIAPCVLRPLRPPAPPGCFPGVRQARPGRHRRSTSTDLPSSHAPASTKRTCARTVRLGR